MKKLFTILALLFGLSAYGQRFIQTFNSANDAWNANLKSVHTNLFIAYRTSTNDGGGGQFWYDPAATTATNLGTVWGNKYGGRVFRVWNGEPVPISWFGAIPTKVVGGTNYPAGTFDNAPKINAAINWARTPTYGPTDVRASVFVPAGDWWISTPITNRYRVDVLGLGCVFSDNEFTSHAVSSSGQVSGASRIRLADAANCPMMVWDLSDASQRYTFAYTDDGLSMTSTVTIASPGVITATGHGLTVGRRVGFTTTGALPTGITASTIYYVASVPTADTLTISATSGGSEINTSGSQSGVHTLVKDPTPKYVAGNTIRGINFFGNSANQTRGDCHIMMIDAAWNIRIDNCNMGNPNGYMIFARDCNTLDIVDSYGNGGSIRNKGVFLHSCADGFMSQSKFGGASGPALWIAGANGWQQQYTGNFLYNNFNGRFTVSGIASDTLTTSAAHDFETGMPIELSAASGATLPTLTRYPSTATDSHVFWAIKVSSTTLKMAYSYEDAMGGTSLAITGGSGTFYVWRGPGAGAYLSGGANNNVLSANRCDQNQNFGIALNKATENVVTGNLLNLNGFDSLTATAELTTSAGVYLRNGSANNVVMGNSMMDWGTNYAQTYGVWLDVSNGRNFIGQNAFKANPSQVDSLISTTGNTTETAVVQKSGGVTVYADSTGSPITIARSDVPGEWKFEISSNTNTMRLKNSYVGNTAWNVFSDPTSMALTLGSAGSTVAPRTSLIYGEMPSTLSGTDTAAGDLYIIAGSGTGASTGGGKLRFYTPDAGASGTTVQTPTEKLAIMREGGIIIKTLATAPSVGLDNGAVYPNSTDSLFYGRLGSAWHTLSTPNKTGVSTISSDASATFTFSPLVSRWFQLLSAPITTDRTVTLSTSFAQQGTEATFIRSAASTGAFNWSIGGLINLTPGSWCTVVYDGSAWILGTFTTSGGTLTDGDKGDITVGSSGSSFTIDNASVTYAKMQNVSAASKLLGRGDSGSGSPQEITLGAGLTMTGTTLSSSGGGTGADPTASVGLTAVNGVATTFLRSDGAPALDVSIAPTWTGAHTFSKNGALSLPTFSVTGTPITGGTATTTKPLALIETSGATSTGWSTSGTMLGVNAPSGFSGRMLDVHLNGISYMSLTSGGTLSVAAGVSAGGSLTAGAAQNLAWLGRSEMLSPSDGVILLQNAANSDFTRLQLGGTTTSFPAIERSGTGVAIKLADGSADAPLTASAVNKVAITAPATGSTLTIADGKTFTSSNTLTLSGTDGSTLNVGTGGTLGTAAYTATGAYQAADSELAAIAGLTSAADRLPYFTGSGTAALATFTSAGRALVDDADASAQRTTLGLGTVATESTVPVDKGGTGATTASGALDALNVAETTVTSATTTDLGAVASDKVSITGTKTITGFGTATAGVKREGRFTGALTLTHNATSLIIPGAASLTTAAGDRFGAYSLGSGNWVVTWYTKANGQAVVGGGGGSVATDSIFTTNGDLAVGTGSSTAARLGAGDYGAALTANGAAASLFYATPNNAVNITEHFLSHLASHTIFTEVFSSVSSTSGVGNDKDHPGVFSLSTDASASATGYMRVGNSSGTMMIGGGLIVYEQVVRIPNLSDGTQTFTAHFGFSEGSYGASFSGNHHIKFIHDNTSANWQTTVKNNNTQTLTASSTAVTTGWTKLRIVVNATASSVSFFVNGTELSSSPMTMNIPDNTDAMTIGWGITKSAGTTARIIDTDYVSFYQKLTNPL